MREIEKSERKQRGCQYCKYGKKKKKERIWFCRYSTCPFHELDNVRSYEEWYRERYGTY